MVGGRVTETIILHDKDKVWVNCVSERHTNECAIYVELTPKARTISPGDSVWWQGRKAFWTPTQAESWGAENTGPQDIELCRIGYSGVSRPTPDS